MEKFQTLKEKLFINSQFSDEEIKNLQEKNMEMLSGKEQTEDEDDEDGSSG